jgi:hypothetical protein
MCMREGTENIARDRTSPSFNFGFWRRHSDEHQSIPTIDWQFMTLCGILWQGAVRVVAGSRILVTIIPKGTVAQVKVKPSKVTPYKPTRRNKDKKARISMPSNARIRTRQCVMPTTVLPAQRIGVFAPRSWTRVESIERVHDIMLQHTTRRHAAFNFINFLNRLVFFFFFKLAAIANFTTRVAHIT